MTYEELLQFIQNDMRMAHVYQPVMIRTPVPQRAMAGHGHNVHVFPDHSIGCR